MNYSLTRTSKKIPDRNLDWFTMIDTQKYSTSDSSLSLNIKAWIQIRWEAHKTWLHFQSLKNVFISVLGKKKHTCTHTEKKKINHYIPYHQSYSNKDHMRRRNGINEKKHYFSIFSKDFKKKKKLILIKR